MFKRLKPYSLQCCVLIACTPFCKHGDPFDFNCFLLLTFIRKHSLIFLLCFGKDDGGYSVSEKLIQQNESKPKVLVNSWRTGEFSCKIIAGGCQVKTN